MSLPFMYGLIVGVLAVWRITHLLAAEDGPWAILAQFRRWIGNGFWGELLDCFYCLSLWVAAPLAIWTGDTAKERVLLWLAFSAGAILLERATEKPVPALYYEDTESPQTAAASSSIGPARSTPEWESRDNCASLR